MSKIWLIVYLTFHFFFFNDTATTEIYTLSLHDALPISMRTATGTQSWGSRSMATNRVVTAAPQRSGSPRAAPVRPRARRSEEHTSELQSRLHLVCRLLLEKKTRQTARIAFAPSLDLVYV